MKILVEKLRQFVVMPSKLAAKVSTDRITGYSLNSSSPNNKWYENSFNLHFGEPDEGLGEKSNEVCSECKGMCCKNLLEHQIRIYMSEAEAKVLGSTFEKKFDGSVIVEGEKFHVLSVDKNGDCQYVTDKGCELGEVRPLWCKMFFCEKYLTVNTEWKNLKIYK